MEAPENFHRSSLASLPTSGGILATWILRFLIVMQAAFRLSDVVLGHFLRFFVVLFRIIGRSHKIGRDIVECLPQSLYRDRQVMGEVVFRRYVACKNCFAVYTYDQCIENRE